MTFIDIIELFIHIIMSVLGAGLLSLYLNRWADHHFKYPIVREAMAYVEVPVGHKRTVTKVEISWGAVLIIFVFYALVGFMIALGIVNPVIPENITGVHLNEVELTIVGLTMVGLIRFITLNNSVDAHRILVDGLTLAFGFGAFIVLHFPDEFNRIVLNSPTLFSGEYPLFFQTLFIFGFILLIGGLVEAIWFIRVKFVNGFLVPETFVDGLQGVNNYLEIGYLQKNVLQALQRTIQKIILNEGVWEICYLGAFGDNIDLLKNMVLFNAKWSARNDNIDYDTLDDDKQQFLLEESRKKIERVGMFLLPSNATIGFEIFKNILKLTPGKVNLVPPIRYVIINRKVVVEIWNAHSKQSFYEPPNKIFASTVCSISEDPTRILQRLREFQAAWGNYVMNNTFSTLSNLSDVNCFPLLSIIIDRSNAWTREELLATTKNRKIKGLTTAASIKRALQQLEENQQIIRDGDHYSRDSKLYVWQDRWLRTKSKQQP